MEWHTYVVFFASGNKRSKEMNTDVKPYNCDLKQYEARLATRDFWDDCGHEWTLLQRKALGREELPVLKHTTLLTVWFFDYNSHLFYGV